MITLLLLLFTGSEASSKVTKQKRSTANLEYVMKILEEQGRLHQVDGELLKRIQTTLSKSKNKSVISRSGKSVQSNGESLSDRKQTILQRTKERQQQLLGFRNKDIHQPQALQSSNRQDEKVQCEDLRRENTRLKKKLVA